MQYENQYFHLFNIEVFHFIHPLHILVVSEEPSTIDHSVIIALSPY